MIEEIRNNESRDKTPVVLDDAAQEVNEPGSNGGFFGRDILPGSIDPRLLKERKAREPEIALHWSML